MGNIQNPGVARRGGYTKVLSQLGLELPNGAVITSGALDPSMTAVDAPEGSIYLSTMTNNIYTKHDNGLSTDWHMVNNDEITKEPTGFINKETMVVSYDKTTGQVSLYNTATPTYIEFIIKGHYYQYAASAGTPWVVPTVLGGSTPATPLGLNGAHPNGKYFLRVSGGTGHITGDIYFDSSVWEFTDLMIAFVFKNNTAEFALRETHNMMPHDAHEEFHWTNGTYIRAAAGLQLAGVYPSTNTNEAVYGVNQVTVYDEDLPSVVPQTVKAVWNVNTYTSGEYTVAYLSGPAGEVKFYTTCQVPWISNAAAPATPDNTPICYTLISGATGTLTDVAEDNYVNMFSIALPVTADAESQKFRRVFFVGQSTFTTLAAAQLQVPTTLNLGELASSVSEYVFTSMASYRRNASGTNQVPNAMGNAQLEVAPISFVGTKNFLTGVTGISPTDHQTLSNRSASDAHPATAISTTGFSTNLNGVTTVQAALALLDTGTLGQIKASGSGGLSLQNSGGSPCLLLGAGGGTAATFYDGVNVTGVLDQASATTLQIGINNATAITLGKSGVTTTNAGAFTSSELLTATLGVTISGGSAAANKIALVSSAMRIGGGTTAGGSLDAGTTPVISWTSTSVTTAQPTTIGAVGTQEQILNGSVNFRYNTSSDRGLSIQGLRTGTASRIFAMGSDVTRGALEFYTSFEARGTAFDAGSYDNLTAWTLGSATTANHATLVHTVYGQRLGVKSNNTSTPTYAAISLTTPNNGGDTRLWWDTAGATGIWVAGVDKDSNTIWKLAYNSNADFESGIAISVASTGAVSFPVNTTHRFGASAGNDAATLLSVTAGGTTRTSIVELQTNGKYLDISLAADGSWQLYDGLTAGKFATITAAGVWTLGVASSAPTVVHQTNGALVVFFATTNALAVASNSATGSAVQMVRFRLASTTGSDGTACGGIQTTDGSTSPAFYTGTSDGRLKEGIETAPSGALSRISRVRLTDFWLKNETNKPKTRGVIAQELQKVYPEHVHVREDGFFTVSMGWDWEFMQAIQELYAELQATKAELAALKAA